MGLDDIIKRVFQLPLDADDDDVIHFDEKPCWTKFKNVFFYFYLKIQMKKIFLGGNLLACIFDRLH